MYKEELRRAMMAEMVRNGVVLPKPPYENRMDGYWFSDQDVVGASEKGRLLTMDLDVGNACDLNCKFCFADTHCFDRPSYVERTTKRVMGLLDDGHSLGLKSIKIVGAGEPLLFPRILDVLEHAHHLGIKTIMFTGGHVIGDDGLARKLFSDYGITCGRDLASAFLKLDVFPIVKFLSLDPTKTMGLVNPKKGGYGYVKFRDNGLLNLVAEGLNSSSPTRLGVDCLMLKENCNEAVELFSFFNKLNIFCMMNTVVDCGNTAVSSKNPHTLSKKEVLDVAVSLYKHGKAAGVPFDRRISSYFLSPPCSQLNHGLFVGDDDTVKICPGGPVIGKYSKGNLEQIFLGNQFRKEYAGCTRNPCISRSGKYLYSDFEKRVRAQIG